MTTRLHLGGGVDGAGVLVDFKLSEVDQFAEFRGKFADVVLEQCELFQSNKFTEACGQLREMILMKLQSLEIDESTEFKRKRVDHIRVQPQRLERRALAQSRRHSHELVGVCIHRGHQSQLADVAGEVTAAGCC
jgi:hypothetical protein